MTLIFELPSSNPRCLNNSRRVTLWSGFCGNLGLVAIMKDRLHSEIRHIISSYIADRQELSSVQDWLWPLMADLEDSDDEAAISVVGRIGNLISEYSDGYMTEAELRKELPSALLPFDSGQAAENVVMIARYQNAEIGSAPARPPEPQWVTVLVVTNNSAWGTVGAGNNNSVQRISPQRETGSAYGGTLPAMPAVLELR